MLLYFKCSVDKHYCSVTSHLLLAIQDKKYCVKHINEHRQENLAITHLNLTIISFAAIVVNKKVDENTLE